MANLLDEVTGPINQEGRNINVIESQIPVKVGFGSIIFEIALWLTIPLIVLILALTNIEIFENPIRDTILCCILGVLPGVIFIFKKVSAKNYFQQLEQKIQAEASNLDNYLELRVQVLENVVGILEKAIELDKDVMKNVAALRGGTLQNTDRNQVNQQLDSAFGHLFPHVEAYPELKAHETISDAMQQNYYLQREITAARTVYNSRVKQWNTDIFAWPTKMIVAARQGYTTRIPFTASKNIKERATSKFF